MITTEQKNMLAAAAKQRKISAIFYCALDMRDIDTCEYIVQNYLTTQHFTQMEIELINKNWAAEHALLLLEQATASTVH